MKHMIMLVTSVTTKRISILLAALFLCSMIAFSSALAGTWPASGYQNVSNTNTADSLNPSVAADANGNPVAVWDEQSQIYAAKYYGSWQPTKKISSAIYCETPSIVSDGYGLYAVWSASIDGNNEIEFSFSLDGVDWSIPENISNSITSSKSPDITADGDGNIYVVWVDDGKIYLRRSTDRGMTWGTRDYISESSGCDYPAIATDGIGRLHIAYQYNKLISTDPPVYNNEIMHRSSSDYGNIWSSSKNVSESSGEQSKYPDIAAEAGGNAIVVWEEEMSSTETEIKYRIKNADIWSSANSLSESPTRHDRTPAISWSRSGEMRVVWSHWQTVLSGGDRDIIGRIYRNGTWTALPLPTVYNTSGIASTPCISENGNGNAVVLWADSTTNPNYYEIFAAQTTGGFTLINEGFENNPLGTSSGWQVSDENATGTACYWDEVGWTTHGGLKSAWCAGVNGYRDESAQAYAYLADMNAVMSRTLDLREYKDASLSYWWRLPSAESGGFASDLGVVNLREGGTYLNDYQHNEVSSVWTQKTIDLTPYCGKVVTMTWRWVSDHIEQGEGLYIDDVLLTGNVKEPVDTIPPSRIDDLAASATGTSAIGLTWTAPGDDSIYGTATAYDIRYSTSTLTSANWGSATKVSSVPAPKSGGGSESLTVNGLSEATKYYFAIKTSDEESNLSDISSIVNATTLTAPDLVAPSAITDLTVESTTPGSVSLSWTATGDDGTTGKATQYDLRYSTNPINEGNWAGATQVTNEPNPSASGVSEFMTVTGLAQNTGYYFALKAIDDAGNSSSLSNTPLGQTTTLQGDVNLDETVDIFDLVIVGRAFGTTPGQANWDPRADLKSDNVIDIFDLVIVGKNFGKTV